MYSIKMFLREAGSQQQTLLANQTIKTNKKERMQLCSNSYLRALSALYGGSIGLLLTSDHLEGFVQEKLFFQEK